MKANIAKGIASVAAVAAIAAGGFAVSSGSNTSTAASSNAAGSAGLANPGGRGFGAPVTGTAATKAKAAAFARYPGTVEQVMKAPSGGGYVVHVIKSDGTEVHVLVSSAFKVTGVETGGPPPGMQGQPPSGAQTPPPGSTSSSSSSTSTS